MEIYHKTYKTCKTFIRGEAAPNWDAAGKRAVPNQVRNEGPLPYFYL